MAKRASKWSSLIIRVGDLVLDLKPAKEGGFVVTSPFDPALITEAETIDEAIANATDASELLKKARAKHAQASQRPAPVEATRRSKPPSSKGTRTPLR